MSSLKEMRDQLRELRKESVKPVSRMKKSDIAAEIERMRERREETPPVAAVGGAKTKKMAPATESVKKAKEKEFPVRPATEGAEKKAKKAAPAAAAPAAKKSKYSKAAMMAMLAEMSDTDEE